MPFGRLLSSRMPRTQFAVPAPVSLRFNLLSCVLFILCTKFDGSLAVCPHCHGHFASCTYGNAEGSCPTVSVVVANGAAVLAGQGALSLSEIIPCRYLKMFTRSALDTMLAIAKRPEPGKTFDITVETSGVKILNAINLGMVSLQGAVMKIAELIEETTEEAQLSKLRSRLECLKVIKTDKFALATSSVSARHQV